MVVCCKMKDMVSISLSVFNGRVLQEGEGELSDDELEQPQQVHAQLEHYGTFALLLLELGRRVPPSGVLDLLHGHGELSGGPVHDGEEAGEEGRVQSLVGLARVLQELLEDQRGGLVRALLAETHSLA